ncbi:hypothetical protein OKA04_05465 [Luteolibacter flavescens]|uniref:Uncharacterized protein n=1 Tax=Luteolibacter flavescens TaxID=1859460 RepID=A0ABT3FKR3_9BACT|nr:hypothetical protein [Luteolibacter flavescens]MCW1884169.1 hypothetical protein [Luteolibacter flavescens]
MKNTILRFASLLFVSAHFASAVLLDPDLDQRGEGYLVEISATGSLESDSGRIFKDTKSFLVFARELARKKMFPRLVMTAGENPSPEGSAVLVKSIMALEKEKIPFSVVFVHAQDPGAKK